MLIYSFPMAIWFSCVPWTDWFSVDILYAKWPHTLTRQRFRVTIVFLSSCHCRAWWLLSSTHAISSSITLLFFHRISDDLTLWAQPSYICSFHDEILWSNRWCFGALGTSSRSQYLHTLITDFWCLVLLSGHGIIQIHHVWYTYVSSSPCPLFPSELLDECWFLSCRSNCNCIYIHLQ
jgi:hypothetical protein